MNEVDDTIPPDIVPLRKVLQEAGYSKNYMTGLLPVLRGIVGIEKVSTGRGGRPYYVIKQKDYKALLSVLKDRRGRVDHPETAKTDPVSFAATQAGGEKELLVLLRRLIHLSKSLSIDEISIADGKAVIERVKVIIEEVLP